MWGWFKRMDLHACVEADRDRFTQALHIMCTVRVQGKWRANIDKWQGDVMLCVSVAPFTRYFLEVVNQHTGMLGFSSRRRKIDQIDQMAPNTGYARGFGLWRFTKRPGTLGQTKRWRRARSHLRPAKVDTARSRYACVLVGESICPLLDRSGTLKRGARFPEMGRCFPVAVD